MSVTYVDVVQEQVGITNTTLYTAPTSANFESAHIIFGNCTNEGTIDTELTLNIVQQGGTVAVTNRYFPPKVIFAGRTDPLTPIIGATLKAGDFISSIGEYVDNLNLKISVKEIYSDA